MPIINNASTYKIDELQATKHISIEEKEKVLKKLQEFSLAGMPERKFTKFLYQHLSYMYGHIAHYNQQGFYQTWFGSPTKKNEWLRHVLNGGTFGAFNGDPKFTMVDVEYLFNQWLQDNIATVERAIHLRWLDENKLLVCAACGAAMHQDDEYCPDFRCENADDDNLDVQLNRLRLAALEMDLTPGDELPIGGYKLRVV